MFPNSVYCFGCGEWSYKNICSTRGSYKILTFPDDKAIIAGSVATSE